ncbi:MULTISPECIES: acyl-CoA dehydrogenase family protein [Clostridium]|uniref:Acyl-coA dehydrogenase n=1 Tax=Clostridium carnis TaxID=1530 RepID=A0ABY6SYR3_9CLOT|nr:acyl-CoA dehydrogenase family protein [Clostridium carnis]CAI3609000.1 butyryl-CoA dehydrogenase [Clostridium neonatale]CAI3614332.1 butyryl-CoA dehydrogenase [Clostridium neonatale]CAI3640175.1 butyryl-CoA dehydrogenase [Clostridium neonatale]CAI3646029.1 butyryl-CoA dehydrogenase [Clostridium neonatale]CAI3649029.1 butyryl-CoA dehydrogenase [Clostridium neonatale]
MFFKTTEQHEDFRARIREFAESEVKPQAFLLDKENRFPTEAIEKLGKMGVLGTPYPKEYGGAGLDVLSYAIAVEELSRVDGGTGVILSAHVSLGTYPIFAYGTEEQKQKYLIPLAKGEKLAAFGLTEPNAGSDAGGTETTAVLEGDYYILNGGKIFITNADKADTYVVFAVTTPDIGVKGISAFIVEKGWEGFTFGDHYDKMGIRSSSTAELIFNNVKVPKENLLGEEGQGFKIAMKTLDGGRIGIASQALGIAEGAYENALEYSKERIQFGKPICQQQAISFKLADMATKIRAARLLVYSAAELKENHEPYSMEAAMAKQYASDICLEVVNDALQIFGGNGYLKGMEVERAYRDAKICTIYEGTNEIQRVVIASHIIGKMPKNESRDRKTSRDPLTGARKKIIFNDGTAEEKVYNLVEALKTDGYDFTVGIDINTPISKADRVVSVGKGIGEEKNMELAKALAVQAGAAIGSSRPVAETLKYLPLNRYVGMSGQKFNGNLYIACGISGAGQHLKGIKEATTIVAINNNPNAPIFKNADYGIVGDIMEIMPILTASLDNGEPKKEAPPMKKMKKKLPKKTAPNWKRYVCNGCGYEYDPAVGDVENEIASGTLFKDLPEEWICPDCGEEKDNFIEV